MSPLRLGLPEDRAVSPLSLGLPEGGAVSPLSLGLPKYRSVSPAETGLSGAGLDLSSDQFSLKAAQCLLSDWSFLGKGWVPSSPPAFQRNTNTALAVYQVLYVY